MSSTRATKLRRAGIIVAAAAAVTLWAAPPAHAVGEVEVSISGLSSTITVGARGESFTVRLENKTKSELQPVRKTLVVRLAGLTAGQLRISRGGFPLSVSESAPGELRAVDPLQVGLGPEGKSRDSSSASYTIQLSSEAPNGKAELQAVASLGNTVLGSASRNFTVKGGTSAQPTASATAIPTDPAATGSVQAFPPLDDTQSPAAAIASSGVPVIFYILGAILVAAGGGILWLLFRPRPAMVAGPDEYPTAVYDAPVRPPSLGYPNSSGQTPLNPTSVLPPVRDPAVGPPSDPWANR